jgi:hypothetical protein
MSGHRVKINERANMTRQLSATDQERRANTWAASNEHQNSIAAEAETSVERHLGVPSGTFAGDGVPVTGPELKNQLDEAGAWTHGNPEEKGIRSQLQITDLGKFAGGKRRKRSRKNSKKSMKKSMKRKTNKKRRHR